ncbi:MAG: diguanylate cyclase [bacterium]|nr:diguanylate cyclase [bacterium]
MYRVLIVDDDPSVLTFVKNALRNEDFEVDTATNAEQAFALLAETLPALMILDINLPRTDGYEILKTIREERRYDLMSIVLLSATGDLESKIKGLDLGAIDYMVKPIHPKELAARVRALLRIKQRHDHIFSEYQRLSELTLTDPLTGAYNRRALDSLLKARLSESTRYSIPVSCVMLDIDHFKQVNDTYGHDVGDLVLREVSRLTFSQCRQEDALIRYGGEEFLVILFHTSKKGAITFSERLRLQVADHSFMVDQKSVRITISVGTATHPEDGVTDEVDTLIKMADRRLYAAKRSGRNKVVSED